jgi:Fic family protein
VVGEFLNAPIPGDEQNCWRLIVSFDSIKQVKPPYTLNSKMLRLCAEIARSVGRLEGIHIARPEPKLRKSNRARTIQASLAIEGNTLMLDQVKAILEGKRVIGPKREILEVLNANKAYDQIRSYTQTHPLILSAVFHYELEFIHPFSDECRGSDRNCSRAIS